jgi:hypothetical protein
MCKCTLTGCGERVTTERYVQIYIIAVVTSTLSVNWLLIAFLIGSTSPFLTKPIFSAAKQQYKFWSRIWLTENKFQSQKVLLYSRKYSKLRINATNYSYVNSYPTGYNAFSFPLCISETVHIYTSVSLFLPHTICVLFSRRAKHK